MNLEQSIWQQGIAAQQDVAGWTFQLISGPTGAKFPGRIDPQPFIDPRMALGSDVRELSIIYALQSDIPPQLDQEDRLSQLDEAGNQIGVWMVVNRDNNPGDIEVKLWATKVTDKDT